MTKSQQRAAELLPAFLLAVIASGAIAFSGNWRHPAPAYSEPLYDPHPIILSPNAIAIGDLEVLFPPGGLNTAIKSGKLKIRGWVAVPREAMSIRAAEFFLDGKMVQPTEASPENRFDLAREFDRIELFYDGWTATLPLQPGEHPHSLELHALLSDGREYTLKRVALQ